MMLRIIALASAIVTAASLAVAPIGTQEKSSASIGAGATTCGEFANFYRSDTEIENYYLSWTQGYLSGLNFFVYERSDHFLNLKPAAFNVEDQKSFLRRYCADNPLRYYEEAVIELIKQIKAQQ